MPDLAWYVKYIYAPIFSSKSTPYRRTHQKPLHPAIYFERKARAAEPPPHDRPASRTLRPSYRVTQMPTANSEERNEILRHPFYPTHSKEPHTRIRVWSPQMKFCVTRPIPHIQK